MVRSSLGCLISYQPANDREYDRSSKEYDYIAAHIVLALLEGTEQDPDESGCTVRDKHARDHASDNERESFHLNTSQVALPSRTGDVWCPLGAPVRGVFPNKEKSFFPCCPWLQSLLHC